MAVLGDANRAFQIGELCQKPINILMSDDIIQIVNWIPNVSIMVTYLWGYKQVISTRKHVHLIFLRENCHVVSEVKSTMMTSNSYRSCDFSEEIFIRFGRTVSFQIAFLSIIVSLECFSCVQTKPKKNEKVWFEEFLVLIYLLNNFDQTVLWLAPTCHGRCWLLPTLLYSELPKL